MKRLTFLSLLLVIWLTGCGAGVAPESAKIETPTTAAAATQPATPAGDVATSPTATAASTAEVAGPPAPSASAGDRTCRPDAITSLINLSQNAGIAPVSNADWQKGDPTARITVVEYGDFQ